MASTQKVKKNASEATTEPVVSTQETTQSTNSSASRKKLILFGLVGVLLGLAIASAAFMYYINSRPKTPVMAQIATTTQPTVKPDQEQDIKLSKRLFDSNKNFFGTNHYPAKLLSLKDDDLIGIRCSRQYAQNQDDREKFSYTDENTSNVVLLTDDRQKSIAEEITKTMQNKNIDAIMFCETEDDRIIVLYEIWGGGGGGNNTAYINLVNPNNEMDQITKIPNDGPAYFGCQKPLALTTSNLFYLNCGGGDGGGGGSSIYEIDLANKTHKLLLKCTSMANNEGTDSIVECS